jgi:hypothetical protein
MRKWRTRVKVLPKLTISKQDSNPSIMTSESRSQSKAERQKGTYYWCGAVQRIQHAERVMLLSSGPRRGNCLTGTLDHPHGSEISQKGRYPIF